MRWPALVAVTVVAGGLAVGCGTSAYPAATVDKDISTAQAMLTEIAAGQDTQAEAPFGAKMRASLTPAALGKAWNGVVAQYGTLDQQGTPRTAVSAGDLIVDVPLRMAHGARVGRIVFDTQGQVVGLFFRG